jgi:eukaryotic translation initiation factor 2-alpha kinase 4
VKENTLEYNFSNYLEQGRFTKSFELMNTLGQGGFGTVFQVKHKLDQCKYAVKKVRINIPIEEDIKNHYVYREIHAMPLLNHKNIVRYYSCWVEPVEVDSEVLKRLQDCL